MRSVVDALASLEAAVTALALAHPALAGAWTDVLPEWDSGTAFEFLDRRVRAMTAAVGDLADALDGEYRRLDQANADLDAADGGLDAALARQQSIEARLRQAHRDVATAGDAASRAADARQRAAVAAARAEDLVAEATALLDDGPWR